MANLALAAPTVYLGGGLTGTILPAAEGGVLTGFTGFTFPNDEYTVVRLVIGAAGAGNLQFVPAFGAAPAVIPVANSTIYQFGSFSSAYNNAAGLMVATLSVVTGNTVGVYKVNKKPTVGALHDPIQMVVSASDY